MCKDAVGKKICYYTICGYKNSGKTTLITKLIPILKKKGYRVATIKHDGHDFESDVPGTDTWKHKEAGAYASGIFSGSRFMISKECEDADIEMLAAFFPEADVILLEGFKNSELPKFWCDYPNLIPDEHAVADKIIEEIRKAREE